MRKVGWLSRVTRSSLRAPVSEPGNKLMANGAAGACRSMVRFSEAEARLTLPSASLAMARRLWGPVPRNTLRLNLPSAAATTAPRRSPASMMLLAFRSSNTVTVAPASAVPVRRIPVLGAPSGSFITPSVLLAPVSSSGLSTSTLGGGSRSLKVMVVVAAAPRLPRMSTGRALNT